MVKHRTTKKKERKKKTQKRPKDDRRDLFERRGCARVPFLARMTAMYCWLKVLTVSSMAGRCEVAKLKATSSLARLLLSVETLEACELRFCITEKGSWNV